VAVFILSLLHYSNNTAALQESFFTFVYTMSRTGAVHSR